MRAFIEGESVAAEDGGHANREMLRALMKTIGSLKLAIVAALLLVSVLAHAQTDTVAGT